jgi:IMP dehydrogenase
LSSTTIRAASASSQVKDIEKAVTIPPRRRTRRAPLRVAAATTVGDKGFERTEALIDAECDLIVIDTAHGHNRDVALAVERIKKLSNRGPDHRRKRCNRGGARA